ncbi:MAG: hypothetical protein JXR83_15935 [Deltaproteobacteria bacterium]|nr:hypothetical protein [Deltaproteobacteria bacterium]
MKSVFVVLALVLAVLGVIFLIGSQGLILRLAVGTVLLASAVALIVAATRRPRLEQRTIVQRIELSGDVQQQELTCRNCGAALGPESVSVRAGAAFVTCRYCGAGYQLEEAPKW